MTVAAVILSAPPRARSPTRSASPRVRRLADLAWSGGALPIVVLAPDPDGAVAAALAGSEAVYGSPAAPEAGPVGQMVRGAELALAEVRDTTAVLLWPARLTWVGPETITSLIEAPRRRTRRRCSGRPGTASPAGRSCCPTTRLDALRAVAPDRMPPEVIDDLAAGDPDAGSSTWATRASSTTSRRRRATCPPTKARRDPPAGHTHEWGADVAAEAGLSES